MTRVEIARGAGFSLVSYGNGEAYALNLDGQSEGIFVQGDEATEFRDAWEALETAKPETDTGELLRETWANYSC